MPLHLPLLQQTIKARITGGLGAGHLLLQALTEGATHLGRREVLVISFSDRLLQGMKGFERSEVSLKVHK